MYAFAANVDRLIYFRENSTKLSCFCTCQVIVCLLIEEFQSNGKSYTIEDSIEDCKNSGGEIMTINHEEVIHLYFKPNIESETDKKGPL